MQRKLPAVASPSFGGVKKQPLSAEYKANPSDLYFLQLLQ